MSKELTVTSIPVITDEQWSLVKRTLMDTDRVQFSDDEFKLFVNQAKRTGLDPFTRQIYATKTGGKMTVQATIDGLRLIAQRSGEYQGQTRPIWFDDEGKEYRVWPKKKGFPYACEVGVYKSGFKEPLYAMAIFDEYVAKSKDFKTQEMKIGYMWQKMPALMIAKVAEALALRKAFPNDMSGIYSSEEIAVEDDVKQLRNVGDAELKEEAANINNAKNIKEKSNPQDPHSYPQKKDLENEQTKENKNALRGDEQGNARDTIHSKHTERHQTTKENNKKEPERFPKKEEITISTISKEQADFLKSTGHKFGYKTNEISKVVFDITGKEQWGLLNLWEFELILQHIIDNRKGL